MAAVDDYLTCPICLDWFKCPRRLPCNHVYCLQCLRGVVNKGTYHITCPECSREHVVPNNTVEEFPADFGLEQLIQKVSKWKPKSQDALDWKDSLRIRAAIQESLLQESRQFREDFLADNQTLERQKLKTHLVKRKENHCILKINVNTEVDGVIKELEKRKLTLWSTIEGEEKSITDDLTKVDQADDICDKYESQTACLVDTVLTTETQISLRDQFYKQRELMTSLQNISQNTRVKDVQFNRNELMKIINSYGGFFEASDRKVFTLTNTLKSTVDYIRINVVPPTKEFMINLITFCFSWVIMCCITFICLAVLPAIYRSQK